MYSRLSTIARELSRHANFFEIEVRQWLKFAFSDNRAAPMPLANRGDGGQTNSANIAGV